MFERQLEELIEIPEIGWVARSSKRTNRLVKPIPLGKPLLLYIAEIDTNAISHERDRKEILLHAPGDANAFSQGAPINILGKLDISPIQYYRI